MAKERLQWGLAAILSADVVGYSRLMGIDEAGTLTWLKALRREIIDPTIAAHSRRAMRLRSPSANREAMLGHRRSPTSLPSLFSRSRFYNEAPLER